MKRFNFIIPVKISLKGIIIVLLLCSSLSSNAEEDINGCHIVTGPTLQSRLYWNPYLFGSGSPMEWIAGSGGGNYNLITATKCFVDFGIPCKVYKYGTTAAMPTATDMMYTGVYAMVAYCPLDDNILILFTFTLGIGLYQLCRPRKLLHK